MFASFATIKAVTAMIREECGEKIGHSAVGNYKKRIWKVQRDRERARRAKVIAYREFVSEGSN